MRCNLFSLLFVTVSVNCIIWSKPEIKSGKSGSTVLKFTQPWPVLHKKYNNREVMELIAPALGFVTYKILNPKLKSKVRRKMSYNKPIVKVWDENLDAKIYKLIVSYDRKKNTIQIISIIEINVTPSRPGKKPGKSPSSSSFNNHHLYETRPSPSPDQQHTTIEPETSEEVSEQTTSLPEHDQKPKPKPSPPSHPSKPSNPQTKPKPTPPGHFPHHPPKPGQKPKPTHNPGYPTIRPPNPIKPYANSPTYPKPESPESETSEESSEQPSQTPKPSKPVKPTHPIHPPSRPPKPIKPLARPPKPEVFGSETSEESVEQPPQPPEPPHQTPRPSKPTHPVYPQSRPPRPIHQTRPPTYPKPGEPEPDTSEESVEQPQVPCVNGHCATPPTPCGVQPHPCSSHPTCDKPGCNGLDENGCKIIGWSTVPLTCLTYCMVGSIPDLPPPPPGPTESATGPEEWFGPTQAFTEPHEPEPTTAIPSHYSIDSHYFIKPRPHHPRPKPKRPRPGHKRPGPYHRPRPRPSFLKPQLSSFIDKGPVIQFPRLPSEVFQQLTSTAPTVSLLDLTAKQGKGKIHPGNKYYPKKYIW